MFGSDLRCPKCNQYFPDRCTCEEWQSNVQWPIECYLGRYGDGVSTDKHRSKEGALNVCVALQEEGFGCMGEHFPIQTWATKVGDPDPILDAIRLGRDIRLAQEETERLQKDRIVPNEKLKERFDI